MSFMNRNRRGNYTMTMGALMPVLIGFAAMSVDISFVNMSALQSQHVSDAASHAAFIAFRATNDFSKGNAAANHVIDQNLIGGEKGALTTAVQYGIWNFDSRSFTSSSSNVNAAVARVGRTNATSNPLDLFFAPILGHDKWDVAGYGVTAARTRQIMLVQDVSGSFGGNDMINARKANLAFLDYLKNKPYPGDKLGMALFGGRVWYPLVQELDTIAGHYDTPGTTNGKPNGMKQRFAAVDVCGPSWGQSNPDNSHGHNDACWTSQARGLVDARNEFMSVRGDPKDFQAVIIISDGLPTRSFTGTSTSSGQTQGERASEQLWGKTKTPPFTDRRSWGFTAYGCSGTNSGCGNKTHPSVQAPGGVHVWTVTFNEGGGDFSWMKKLEQGLGTSYETPDSSKLAQIMVEIAQSIPVVLTE